MTLPLRRSSGWLTAALLGDPGAGAGGLRPGPGEPLAPAGRRDRPDRCPALHGAQGRPHPRGGALQPRLDRRQDVGHVYQRYLEFLDGQRSYFLASDINEFDAYRLKFDDMIRTGDIDPAYLIFARFQQRNRERIQHAIALLKTEPDWTLERDLRVRPQQGAVAGRPGHHGRAVAQARQERRPVADAHRQELAGGRRDAAQALRAGAEARRPGDLGGRVREPDERLRARLRSALELLLAAQLRGVPHPDEPELRRHRRLAAAGR